MGRRRALKVTHKEIKKDYQLEEFLTTVHAHVKKLGIQHIESALLEEVHCYSYKLENGKGR